MDETRALLDQLMGRERDVPVDKRTNRVRRFSDDDICKPYLCGAYYCTVCTHGCNDNEQRITARVSFGLRPVTGFANPWVLVIVVPLNHRCFRFSSHLPPAREFCCVVLSFPSNGVRPFGFKRTCGTSCAICDDAVVPKATDS